MRTSSAPETARTGQVWGLRATGPGSRTLTNAGLPSVGDGNNTGEARRPNCIRRRGKPHRRPALRNRNLRPRGWTMQISSARAVPAAKRDCGGSASIFPARQLTRAQVLDGFRRGLQLPSSRGAVAWRGPTVGDNDGKNNRKYAHQGQMDEENRSPT